ncbi:APC family permease [Bifidobacterium vansinderenii]|uniref:Amino acid permease n=1 Tax=Bifidobacterium vansinderenii TaxID=1984871 RepID=A0A229VZP2_9BIFI|nr:APC family permease [Bifidobacterium vansinderenii]OXN01099.1 amino acid permease [Bifidobacterium vansinderenii]
MTTQTIGQTAVEAKPVAATVSTPQLQRTMGLRSIVLLGLAYMCPIIVLGTFGVISATSHGATAMSYAAATIAMLFTAGSYGRMAVLHPEAGSAYTYVGKTISRKLGFLVGWAVLLDYMFLPMVVWLIGASYLAAKFPAVPIWAWVLGFIVLTTAINIVGLSVADKINFALMTFQAIVIITFVGLSIRSVVTGDGASALVSAGPFLGDGSSLSAVVAGGAIAAYSFLGFDAVTTLSEETRDPKKTMPRAILLIAAVGGLIFIGVSYFTQLVHPGGVFIDESSAAYEIAAQIGGNLFTSVFIAGLCFGQFTSGIATQASASRLLYVMGRDGVLPKKFFGRLSAKFDTPVLSILLVAAIGLIAMFLDVATSTSFVNFGAFTSFTLVNVCVIVAYLKADAEQRKEYLPGGALRNILLPILGALFCLYLLVHLDIHALILGLSWLAIGVVILAVLTGGFKHNPPEYNHVG